VVQVVNNKIDGVLGGATSSAEREYGRNPQVWDLVSVLNNGVRDFWTGLKSVVSSFHKELKEGSKASDQEAWELIREMLSAVFMEIEGARSVARSVAAGRPPRTLDDHIGKASLIIWGTVQAHRVMEEIKRAEFKRHHCVVPSLTLFLFNHRAPTQMVIDLQAKVAADEKDRQGLRSEMHKLRALVDKVLAKGK
jgi:hypothetical protein